MNITRADFEVLYLIEFMQFNNPNQLSEQMNISKEEATKKLKRFEKRGLIVIEYRENKIYGSQLTEKGKKIYSDSKYGGWKEELGY